MDDDEARRRLQKLLDRSGWSFAQWCAYSEAIERELGGWPAYRGRWSEKLAIAERIERQT